MNDEIDEIDAEEEAERRVAAMFDAAEDEYLEFDRIPIADRPSNRPDLCAFLYLDNLQPDDGSGVDMVVAAEHDVIYLAFECDKTPLTQEDVIYLARCGVMHDGDSGGLSMFA